MMHKSIGDRIFQGINGIILLLVAALMLIPFLYMFSVSFSSLESILGGRVRLWPTDWSMDAYDFIFANDRFIRSIGITVFITVVGTLLNLIFTSTMAYGMSRPFFGQSPVIFMVLLTFLFSPGMIPAYLIVKETFLLNSIWALIIPVLISPWNLIIFRQFFRNIPGELHEAAHIDGASEWTVFSKIILPLSKPALATFGLFYAVAHWNTYFTGILYLNNPLQWPIQVLLRQIVVVNDTYILTEQLLDNPPPPDSVQMAAVLLATVPILIVYPFLQKHFAKGVMVGSVKG